MSSIDNRYTMNYSMYIIIIIVIIKFRQCQSKYISSIDLFINFINVITK